MIFRTHFVVVVVVVAVVVFVVGGGRVVLLGFIFSSQFVFNLYLLHERK